MLCDECLKSFYLLFSLFGQLQLISLSSVVDVFGSDILFLSVFSFTTIYQGVDNL